MNIQLAWIRHARKVWFEKSFLQSIHSAKRKIIVLIGKGTFIWSIAQAFNANISRGSFNN